MGQSINDSILDFVILFLTLHSFKNIYILSIFFASGTKLNARDVLSYKYKGIVKYQAMEGVVNTRSTARPAVEGKERTD